MSGALDYTLCQSIKFFSKRIFVYSGKDDGPDVRDAPQCVNDQLRKEGVNDSRLVIFVCFVEFGFLLFFFIRWLVINIVFITFSRFMVDTHCPVIKMSAV